MLRPGTHAMQATFSVAPAVGLSNSGSQLKLSEAFAWHLSGNGAGLAAGAEVQESFGNGVFGFEVGPKVAYDFAIIPDVGFYLSPSVMMGIAIASGYGQSAAAFDMQLGIEAKLLLNDRALLFMRPFSLDIAVGDALAVRYDLILGGGVAF
jgi:hypothetical protein